MPDAVARIAAANESIDDARWAARARAGLVAAGVPADAVDQRLDEVADQLLATGETATGLYGPASQWVHEQVSSRAEDRLPFVARPFGARTAWVGGLAFSALVAAVLGVVRGLQQGMSSTWTLGDAVAPALVAVAVAGALVAFEHVRTTDRPGGSVLGLALLWGCCVGAHEAAGSVSLGVQSTWWWALPAVLCLLVSVLVGLTDDPLPEPVVDRLPDDVWLATAERELTARGDLLPGQVEGRLAEVREFAAESGTSLADQFGSPVGFAHLLPVDRQAPPLRPVLLRTLLFTGLAVLTLATGDDGWTTAAVVAILGLLLVATWARWARQLRRHRRPML